MRSLAIRLLITLILSMTSLHSFGDTVVAVKTGIWTSTDTWNCRCMPKRTDSIIIPQGIIVSVMQPLSLRPSKQGEVLSITIAGTLNISSGSIIIDPIDRIIILPGGKVSTKSNGGMIFSGDYALYLEGGTIARGPLTLGNGFSPPAISSVMTDNTEAGLTLSWRSGREIDVNFYYVSRSADGLTFERLGKIDGRGSQKEKVYSFTDETKPSGIVHYRIELTSITGVAATVANVDVNVNAVARNPAEQSSQPRK